MRTNVVRRISHRQRMSASHPGRERPAAGPAYLEHLALKLSGQCGLPLPLARRRVAALVISAQPREKVVSY
jgi:hypothetical protein